MQEFRIFIKKKIGIMKRFALKTKDGEVVNTTTAEDALGAAENFAILKRLTVASLLSIFDVELFIR